MQKLGFGSVYANDIQSISAVNQEAAPLALKAATNSSSTPLDSTANSVIADDQALMNNNRPSLNAAFDTASASDEISSYTVRDGDTVKSVAEMFGVSENTIRWANDLGSKSTLKKDQELLILPVSGVKYTIKKGDTVKSIASATNGDANEILSYNNIEKEADLKAGEEIIIPNGEIGSIKTTGGGSTTSSTGTTKPATTNDKGYFSRPVIGGVKTQGLHGHNGVDLANVLNTPILAAASGKIIVARQGGWNGGYGNYIVISHTNGMQTLYGHLNKLNVTNGQQVTKGQVIGYMGSTGESTGVHLHFEVRGGTNPF